MGRNTAHLDQKKHKQYKMKSPLDFQTSAGRKWGEETTLMQIQATFHRKGKITQSVEPKSQETKLRAMEKFPDFEF